MDNTLISRTADNIRMLAVSMVEKAKSGHPGGAMGGADFMSVLFTEFLNFDPEQMDWPNRDRFFLDPGHMSPMLYATLALFDKFSMDDLKNFRQWGSPTPGHPELNVKRGIENTSGPLGQGHAMAAGAAIAERFLAARFGEWMSHTTYTYISDGAVQEEISQGVGRIAGFLGLSNLIMFYDSNDIQLSTKTSAVTGEDTAKKYEAWGWLVLTIDGHDHDQIREALSRANEEKDRPCLIIGKTIMGRKALNKDGQSYENQVSTHGMPLSDAGGSFEKTVTNLGGDPAEPFKVFPDVSEYFNGIITQKKLAADHKKKEQSAWEAKNPELAGKLQHFLSGKLPQLDYSQIQQKENLATRGASGAVLAWYADHIENLIVASADLSNSDKTDSYLKKTKAFVKGDFSGSFLQAGVAELTMAAVSSGIALHGGIIPVCATFFVFSDYMKPAVRMAALMELPVKYVWTHDAFRVGEDGPTHQPVEQEAQIRLLEQMKNHSGNMSLLVLRPADGTETTVAWKLAMENRRGPSALILSRQGIKDLPARPGSDRFTDALQAAKGAYIVGPPEDEPDIILLGNGSEVSTLMDGAALLVERKNLRVQVVSAISEGLFRKQEISYQIEVLPPDIPVLGLTAGLPSTLQGLTGPYGRSIGMESFGFSAPYKVLDEKLGFNAENVYIQALDLLGIQNN